MSKPSPGEQYGHLTIIFDLGQSMYLCVCDCGNRIQVHRTALNSTPCTNCGAKTTSVASGGRVTHGMAKTPEYNTWRKMISRCTNEDDKSYKDYGEKGIKVCDRWMDFNCFIEDMGLRPEEGMTIDRVESTGNYEPGNCTWATKTEQARNRSTNKLLTMDGETKTVAEWTELYGHKRTMIADRLKAGWTVEDAIKTPSRSIE